MAPNESEEKTKVVTVGLIQTHVSDDIARNMKITIEKIKEATLKGAEIVCLTRTL